ncbi:MAG: transcription elongation factor GreA [Micavibrio sp.]
MDKVPITRGGLAALEQELRERIQKNRPEIIEAIAEARAHGDLSENAEYSAAKEKQSFNEGRIKELESVIGAAEIIDPSQFKGQKTVKFGANVIIIDENTDEERKFQIVGEYESNAEQGRISITSPIARALIGKSEGDSVTVNSPKGAASYEIAAVAFE